MTERKITPVHYTVLIKIFERDGFNATGSMYKGKREITSSW
jgi:hypothetical protein